MKNPLNLLRKLAMSAFVLGCLAFSHVASAANIEFDVWLDRYGWVIIKPGSGTGGAIRFDGANYYTDRVKRGERLYIFATPSAGETTAARYDVWCASLNRYLVNPVSAPWYGWCWYEEYVVSTSASADNIYIDFVTNRGLTSKRIPIGARPL